MRHEIGEVEPGAAIEERQVIGHAAPIARQIGIAEQARELLAHGADVVVAHRRHRDAVLPEHVERDALHHLHRQVGLDEHAQVGVRVRVDEPGRHVQPVGVDDPRVPVDGHLRLHRRDAAVAHQHVGAPRGQHRCRRRRCRRG